MYCPICGEVIGSSLCQHETAEGILAKLAPGLAEDILMALRLAREVRCRDLVPFEVAKKAEDEFMNREGTDTFCTPLNDPPKKNPHQYSHRTIAMMQYLDAYAR